MNELTGYWQVNLADMLEELGEDKVKAILSGFSCPLNDDVEYFLKTKAIEFARQRIAATHLVFASFQKKPVLVGYYALANKNLSIKANCLNSKLRSKMKRFGIYDEAYKCYDIAVPLIGQLGKNYQNDYNKLITGDELLKMACVRVYDVQRVMGGRLVYLECEDTEKLTDFYTRNGFVKFANRNLDGDEIGANTVRYLVQMLKYLSDEDYAS